MTCFKKICKLSNLDIVFSNIEVKVEKLNFFASDNFINSYQSITSRKKGNQVYLTNISRINKYIYVIFTTLDRPRDLKLPWYY